MYKPLADSTLMNMTKKEIIEHFRIAEHNHKVAKQMNNRIKEEGLTDAYLLGKYDGIKQGRADAIDFFKSLIIRDDEDYDKPTISMKFLNDYIEQMIIDGFGEQLKE